MPLPASTVISSSFVMLLARLKLPMSSKMGLSVRAFITASRRVTLKLSACFEMLQLTLSDSRQADNVKATKIIKIKLINLSLDGCIIGDCYFLLFNFTVFSDFLHQMYFIKVTNNKQFPFFNPKMKIKEENINKQFSQKDTGYKIQKH